MNNKTILVIILATVLAFLGALFIYKKGQVTDMPDFNSEIQSEQLSVEENVSKIDEKNMEISKDKAEIKSEPAVVKQKEELPLIKPVFVTETSQSDVKVSEEIERHDVIKEADSDVIIITREYKMKSPEKYSFR